jgi:hypothetical protein
MHILAGVEEIDPVLEILGTILCLNPLWFFIISDIDEFLSLQPGDIELYFGDLGSLVTITSSQRFHILYASLTDFLMDPTRSKQFWINPCARHAVFAHQFLQLLQFKSKHDCFSCEILTLTLEKKSSPT